MQPNHLLSRRGLLAAAASLQAGAQPAKPPRIGIIGLGRRSSNHFAAFHNLAGLEVTAVCDIDSAAMAKANARLPRPAVTYTDYRELVRDANVDTVVIVAPNYLHHEMAIAAMRAGKDVVLEKPLAIRYPDALAVRDEARRTGRILAVCMQRRFYGPDVEVRQAVESGAIGAVKFVHAADMRGDWNPGSWQYTSPSTGKKTNWRYLKATAGSAELELSVHTFAHVCSFVKSPLARVSASGGVAYYRDRETRDLSSVLVDFENGARLNYSFSCFAQGAGSPFTVVGDKGVLRREGRALQVVPFGGKPVPFKPTSPISGESMETQLYREFFESVRTRTPSPLGPDFALEPAKIAYAAEMSITENRIVTSRDFA